MTSGLYDGSANPLQYAEFYQDARKKACAVRVARFYRCYIILETDVLSRRADIRRSDVMYILIEPVVNRDCFEY